MTDQPSSGSQSPRFSGLGRRLKGRYTLARAVAGAGVISLLAASASCSPGSTTPDQEIPQGPCPPPGPGISMGGVGGVTDAVTTPVPILVLMGGGVEDVQASTAFVEAARGGDIIALRASGSIFTYPNFFFFALLPSVKPSSVNTILLASPDAGAEEAVLCRLGYAEAIWLAGGDQKDYLVRWPPELHAALADFVEDGGAMGGTSAGAVSLGEAAFDADEGTITSEAALQDPLASVVSLSYPTFAHPKLHNTLVDSHFSQRDREGRLLAFLARFMEEREKSQVVGVGLDEGMALILEGSGFRVMGPASGAVWVYRVMGPAGLVSGQPLDLEGILRVKLEPGDQGDWPLDFSALSGVQLRVQGGVVESP